MPIKKQTLKADNVWLWGDKQIYLCIHENCIHCYAVHALFLSLYLSLSLSLSLCRSAEVMRTNVRVSTMHNKTLNYIFAYNVFGPKDLYKR